MMKIRNRQKGFTLIELLIVVAIIGIIAAILIPNFLDALHKGRQKRTMGDFREFGTAVGSYYTDIGGAAAAGATVTQEVDITEWQSQTNVETNAQNIAAVLVPDYIQQIPEADGWGNLNQLYVVLNNPPRTRYMLFRSPGRNDVFEGTTYTSGSFHPTDYDQDIVFADGGFARAPSGAAIAAGT